MAALEEEPVVVVESGGEVADPRESALEELVESGVPGSALLVAPGGGVEPLVPPSVLPEPADAAPEAGGAAGVGAVVGVVVTGAGTVAWGWESTVVSDWVCVRPGGCLAGLTDALSSALAGGAVAAAGTATGCLATGGLLWRLAFERSAARLPTARSELLLVTAC